MNKNYGMYKTVYIFNKFVIKTPRFHEYNIIEILWDFVAIYTEQYNWTYSSKKEKKLLCPTYYITLIPISIQPKVRIINEKSKDISLEFINRLINELNIDLENDILGKWSDINENNLGYYKGEIVKIDYEFIYYIHNFFIDLRNKIKRLTGGE